jgi:hypothetical protein
MSDLCYDIAIMQPQTNNPFPLSDKPDNKPSSAEPAPMPKPATDPEATPKEPPSASGSIFVLPSQAAAQSISMTGPLAGVEKALIKVFSHPAIQLPEFLKDMFARYLPWITLMGIFILAPIFIIGIAMGGFLGIITSFYSLNTNIFFWLTLTLLLIKIVLMSISVPHLLQERRKGWVLLFVSVFVSILYSITNIFAQFLNPLVVIGVTLFIVVSAFYVLFQTRGYFTK